MFRFLPGVLLLQLVACALLWLNLDALRAEGHTLMAWARFLIPLLVVALVTAFWFGALSRHLANERINKLQSDFAKEREKLKVDAERSKTRVIEKSQKTITREAKRNQAKASFKVGAAVTGVVAFGVFMTFTQFALMGLVLLGGAGALLGGYALKLRGRNQALTSDTVTETVETLPRQKRGLKRLLPGSKRID